jgi:ferredoxin-NADP reductase
MRLDIDLFTTVPPPASPPPSAPSPPADRIGLLAHGEHSQAGASSDRWEAVAVLLDVERPSQGECCLTFRTTPNAASLLPCQHLMLAPSADDASCPVRGERRPFTPISVGGGSLSLLVRMPSEPAAQADAGQQRGAFSRWLTSLSAGARVMLSGPCGEVALDMAQPAGDGGATLRLPRGVALHVRRLALVAAGSGVAAVAQVLHTACARVEASAWRDDGSSACGQATTAVSNGGGAPVSTVQSLQISVLLSDRTPESALLRGVLETLRARCPQLVVRFHRTYTALPAGCGPPDGASARRIDCRMLGEKLPPPGSDTVVVCCGPTSFEAAMAHDLATVGHRQAVLLSSAAHVCKGHVCEPALQATGADDDDVRRLLTSVRDGPMSRAAWPWEDALRCCLGQAGHEVGVVRRSPLAGAEALSA